MTETLSVPDVQLVNKVLEKPSLIDRVVFGSRDPFLMTGKERDEFLLEVVTDNLFHHVRSNPRILRFFERSRFSPNSISEVSDLSRVPQLSTDVFKRSIVTSSTNSEGAQSFLSSGTSGLVSRIRRDDLTLQRLVGSMRHTLRFLQPYVPTHANDEDLDLVNLGPSREEAGEIWFSYIMAMAELIAPTTYYVSGGVPQIKAAAEAVIERIRHGEIVGIVGAPFLVVELMREISNRKILLRALDRLFIITGGGWKRQEEEAIEPADLRAMAVDTFGLMSEEQIRDGFNQVELNSVFFECQYHRKHVPPWVYVVARRVENLQELPVGNSGLLSYIDASAMSYPAFFVSDDIGIVSSDCCPCGRSGPTVTYRSRISRGQSEGCSSKLEEALFPGRESCTQLN